MTSKMNNGDRLVVGTANLNKARAELREAATTIAGVGGRAIRFWIERLADTGGDDVLYFSCAGTKGWFLSTNGIDLWKIYYTEYNGQDNEFYSSNHGFRELPAHVIMDARANLHVLVDGLIDQFPVLSRAFAPFFAAAGE